MPAPRAEQEDGRCCEERREHEIIEGARGLDEDDRQRGEDERAEGRLRRCEPDPPCERRDGDDERDEGGELRQGDVAVASREQHRGELADLGVRRVDVQAQVDRVRDVSDLVLLVPERRACQVVGERIAVIRWDEEGKGDAVRDPEADGHREDQDSRPAQRLAERGNRRRERRRLRPPEYVPRRKRDEESQEERRREPRARDEGEGREQESRRDEPAPRENVCREEELERRREPEATRAECRCRRQSADPCDKEQQAGELGHARALATPSTDCPNGGFQRASTRRTAGITTRSQPRSTTPSRGSIRSRRIPTVHASRPGALT